MVNYVGFGCSAHSFVENKRFNNISNIETYISNISKNKSVQENVETLTSYELIEETIMLGLRTVEGINLNKLIKNYNYNLLKEKEQQILELLNQGLIKVENNHLFATVNGFYVLNQIILNLVS